MSKLYVSVACNLDTNMLLACLPLFQAEKVEAIEWSFDALFKVPEVPPWFEELLQAFSREKRLIGHGVFFSLFSGRWLPEQQAWLDHLKEVSSRYQFDHITEHFGFMTGEDFHKGAPISIPCTKRTLAIGRDRLKRIANACQCPVGLENLAFSYSLDEVKRHGAFLDQLIEPVNGFIILDLHNLFCQLHNFEQSFEELIRLYPLERVREIHISGGSWEVSDIVPGKKIRRDTHDARVPAEVFRLLEQAIPLCPNLKFVVLEQLGMGLKTEESRLAFQQDFIKLEQIVQTANNSWAEAVSNTFLPDIPFQLGQPAEDSGLHKQQQELSGILETAKNYDDALLQLKDSSLALTGWEVEGWQPAMLETALRIAQKWKEGFV